MLATTPTCAIQKARRSNRTPASAGTAPSHTAPRLSGPTTARSTCPARPGSSVMNIARTRSGRRARQAITRSTQQTASKTAIAGTSLRSESQMPPMTGTVASTAMAAMSLSRIAARRPSNSRESRAGSGSGSGGIGREDTPPGRACGGGTRAYVAAHAEPATDGPRGTARDGCRGRPDAPLRLAHGPRDAACAAPLPLDGRVRRPQLPRPRAAHRGRASPRARAAPRRSGARGARPPPPRRCAHGLAQRTRRARGCAASDARWAAHRQAASRAAPRRALRRAARVGSRGAVLSLPDAVDAHPRRGGALHG